MTRFERQLFNNRRSQLEYILTRQEFIAPSFLPTISESFLRDDFNFAEYLSYGFEHVLGYMFNLSSVSLITIGISMSLWASIESYVSLAWHVIISMLLVFESLYLDWNSLCDQHADVWSPTAYGLEVWENLQRVSPER